MQRCLQLAKLGAGLVEPNPQVGAVIVHQNRIIAEGWHQRFGGPHAEVMAINQVSDHTLLSGSTLYVNLEPCNHHGKTPPCTELILQSGIKQVVIGSQDPNPLVAGKGIERLREAGVEVIQSIEADSCLQVNKAFYCFHQKKRPYNLLKWAQSIDGFIGRPNEKVWISNDLAGIAAHRLRAQIPAILIAENTAALDNPALTTRHWPGRSPIRIVLDRRGELKDQLQLFDGNARTIILSYNELRTYPNAEKILIDISKPIVSEINRVLYDAGILSLLVEGGSSILSAYIESGTWDEAIVFEAPAPLTHGIKAPVIELLPQTLSMLGDNKQITYSNFS